MAILGAGVKLTGDIGEALELGFDDAVGVLGVEADFAVVIDDLRMEGKDHVFFQDGVAGGADDRILDHGGADAVAGEMS